MVQLRQRADKRSADQAKVTDAYPLTLRLPLPLTPTLALTQS